MEAIGKRDEKNNAFAKHLAIYHPDQAGNKEAFEFRLEELHNKPLSRPCSESDYIHRSSSQIQMNSKAEWHQPAVPRVVVTTELEDQRLQAGGRRTRGRA